MSIYHKSKLQISEEIKDIEKARENPRAFSVLYTRYYRDIYLFVYKRVSDKEDTEDLVSHIFIKAMHHLPKYEFRGLPFSSWLFRIASNEVNLFFRRSKKIRCVSLENSGVERIKEDLEENISIDTFILAAILEFLREEEVELLELRYFESLSVKEVAEILSISESNVKVKVFRLLEKIRKLIAKEGLKGHE